MFIIFYVLVVFLRIILALSDSDTYQPGSNSSNGSVSFFVPLSQFEPVIIDCQYSNTHISSFPYDSSKCLHTTTTNPASIQFPKVEKFVNDFSQASLSIPALDRFLEVQIPVSKIKDIFYKIDYKLFKDIGHPMPEFLADNVAQTIGLHDDFPLSMYFKVTGYTVAKFLLTVNIELGYNEVQCYAYFLERALQSSCIISDEELYQAFLDGFVNYVESFGFNFLEKSDLLCKLFITGLLTFLES